MRSVTLVNAGPKLFVDVTAEVPVASYEEGAAPDPQRVAGVDLGIIHPFALASTTGGLVVSGRAIRAENRLHLAEKKARARSTANRAPKKGQAGSRRWKQYRRRTRKLEERHRRRVSQATHEAARAVVDFAVGTSSTCPRCRATVAKPKGWRFRCISCGLVAHRDVVGAANIASRGTRGGESFDPAGLEIMHRRAGRHLPGRTRRDPRRVKMDHHRDVVGPWPAVARPTRPSSGSPSALKTGSSMYSSVPQSAARMITS